MAQFFISRPIFAWVLSIIVMLAGALAVLTLPLEQFPDIAPPRVSIGADYVGASAATVDNSVTQVIEQQLKGIDNLLYINATSNEAGQSRTTLTFAPGTNIDVAQMQVQNKLQQAMSRLPNEVTSRGVFVTKGGQDFLMVVSFNSPDPGVSHVDVGDYVRSNLLDVVARVDGVGDVQVFGTGYAMRVWLDPAKLEKLGLMPGDVANAIQAQNAQVSAGQLGALPSLPGQQLNAAITARTKLQTAEEFEQVFLKVGSDGSAITIGDVARVELGPENLTVMARLDGKPGSGMGIVLADGANALDVAEKVKAKLAELAPNFPYQLQTTVVVDSTPFVRNSINEVVKALFEALALVVLVMFLFLQSLRATLIPAIAVPVVLLGTFGVLAVAGYSINTLTMFGLVLAIGLLVDDAIVVVENVERVMHDTGLPPKQATRQSMAQITPALIGITLTLSAVFIPMAFFGGSTGIIYRQFSITIVTAMVLSVLVALTLTPALCASVLKPPSQQAGAPRGWRGLNARFFAAFNRGFERLTHGTVRAAGLAMRHAWLMLLAYGLAIAGIAWGLYKLPTSFVPEEDQGLLTVIINPPAGATAERTGAVAQQVSEYFRQLPEVMNINVVTGLGGNQASGRAFVRLTDWAERPRPEQSAKALAQKATRDLRRIRDANIIVTLPPVVRGLGSSAGFLLELKDMNELGHQALMDAKDELLRRANADPRLTRVRAQNADDTAQLRVAVDDRKAGAQGLATADVNRTLSIAMGGSYINDFVHNGRIKRVYVQGDAPYRMLPQDIHQWAVRNGSGQMVRFDTFSSSGWSYGSPQLRRYNATPAIEIEGEAAPGVSTGEAMTAMEELMQALPAGIGHEWSGASYQERQAGAQAPVLYAISVLFVFLCLAALYESWTVPLAVILCVPLGVLGAVLFTSVRGLDNDVYFQVGLLTTMGLASKNAILIVEFATQLQAQGKAVFEATLEAVRLRLRPILMTSLAFGVGVLPLAAATGAGAAGRHAIGTAVLGGTVFSTVLGLFFVPVFFLLIRSWFKGRADARQAAHQGSQEATA
ncbi:MAG: efflux RND transporter permease subunit [Pseudomonadota bacterium]|nr:efflux RND transporter permease subunit [Pseudomonadota bacterium]